MRFVKFVVGLLIVLAFLVSPYPRVRGDILVSSGYYDLSPAQSGGGPALPSPWAGDANTTFYGTSGDISASTSSDPDISGILVQNTGAAAVTLMDLKISAFDVLNRAMTPSGNYPGGNITLVPGQNYIFCVGDGSEESLTGQTITINFDGNTHAFPDAITTLAPSGVLAGDMPQLGGGDETQPWTPDADIVVPEPSTLALLVLGSLGLLVRRKFAV
jgi:hypothetical protein